MPGPALDPAPAKATRAPRRAPAAARAADGAPPPEAAPGLAGLAGLGAEGLARALRAVAAELERDPALARRVADAVRVPAPDGPRAADVSDPPSPRRGGGGGEVPPPKPAGRPFRPRVIEGISPDLGPGIPDPFALRARLGEGGLRAALDELRLGSLRAIVREHGLDPSGAALRGNDAERLRALILDATTPRGASKASKKR